MPSGLMTTKVNQIDEAAFGVVYGSISVMAVLMAMHSPIEDPGFHAVLLFGTVFVVAVAKAYAEVCERMLKTGNAATWSDVGAVWQHSRTILLAGNGPTIAFICSAFGLISPDRRLLVAQLLAIGLLGWFGGRIGLRVRGSVPSLGSVANFWYRRNCPFAGRSQAASCCSSQVMVSDMTHGPTPKARSIMRFSPMGSRVRLKACAWPLRNARVRGHLEPMAVDRSPSKPLIVA